jgi:hypothetical protein
VLPATLVVLAAILFEPARQAYTRLLYGEPERLFGASLPARAAQAPERGPAELVALRRSLAELLERHSVAARPAFLEQPAAAARAGSRRLARGRKERALDEPRASLAAAARAAGGCYAGVLLGNGRREVAEPTIEWILDDRIAC